MTKAKDEHAQDALARLLHEVEVLKAKVAKLERDLKTEQMFGRRYE
jgi:hypothetical protein